MSTTIITFPDGLARMTDVMPATAEIATEHGQHVAEERARNQSTGPVEPIAADLLGDNAVLTWQSLALCRQTDPEAFFPEKGGTTIDAKRICRRCAVRDDCLNFALDHDERFGVWGGLSERERRQLRLRVA